MTPCGWHMAKYRRVRPGSWFARLVLTLAAASPSAGALGAGALGAAASLGAGAALAGQEPTAPSAPSATVLTPAQQDSLPNARPLLAASEVLLVNAWVNRVNAWALGEYWARVGTADWSRNLRLGWEWDENAFGANTFAHPYHGALYFNAGRSNGLDFWESAPLVFLGSWTWEYFGETYRPSLNDFFMTSFGGIALGEVFHRLAASIRDNRAGGPARTWREVAALPFDPVGSLNRLVRGDWSARGPNPEEHDPESFVLRLGVGGRVSADSGYIDREDDASASATLQATLKYGDPFTTSYEAPFDVFSVRARVSPGGDGLNLLRASGRLFGWNLDDPKSGSNHVFAVNQRFDFVNNPAQRFGAQSVELGVYSRWRLSRTSGLRTHLFGDVIFLGAMEAPFAGIGERAYDFGPGGGSRVEIAYERNGLTYVRFVGRSEYIHTVSGASADHNVSFGGLEFTIPVALDLSLALQGRYYNRVSRYSDRPDERREFPEFSVLLVWTDASLPGFNR